ncbi:hypothetical protein SERLA73DRAFT_181313 [Serpula lacrymans var. lacrymans S7.3]|uniref:Calcium-dependent phosphotriesterase n=2 Tax=Serpula lacrymans var. lacrymans TaxID=341189 RepID=F8PXU6_SERL3|nr:uncharacterized protein SERLADRAFT_467403 [Serpula lacrymans var. lacrymans S7.9]EGN98709.1 hypothetical protein SERLA73DRAFT_181313 [Serpula lacrymans var. lacrymans S7.3]EGO24312.1 hypothetical protein SERLADRAFT_467403 [Serpula lacrymans var. lacrymans S7.9]
MYLPLAALVTLIATFAYRSGRIIKHNILSIPDLPEGYYQGGDWKEKCNIVADEGSHTLKYCEDMTFWDHFDAQGALEERLILMGCDPNRKAWNTVMGPLRDPEPRGYLWLYSATSHGSPQPVSLDNYPEAHDFHPLGLEIYPSHAGDSSNLFIINHARAGTTIEQFTLNPASPTHAVWVRTLTSPYFVSPNALALTSPTSFYVSNDHLMTRRLPSPFGHVLPLIESVGGLPLSWLSHISVEESTENDGEITLNHTFAAFGVSFANGVAISPSGTELALSGTSMGEVYFYKRDPSTNKLTYAHTVPVPFFNDNVMYDDSGALIVTGHPHFPSLIAVAANKTGAVSSSWSVSISPLHMEVASPSFALREYDMRAPLSASKLSPATMNYEVETLFQSNGTAFQTSCTTLRDAETGILYMIGLYEEGLMVCTP